MIAKYTSLSGNIAVYVISIFHPSIEMHGSYNKSTLVSTTTTSGCTNHISQMILQEVSGNLDPENMVKDNFNYEVSSYSA